MSTLQETCPSGQLMAGRMAYPLVWLEIGQEPLSEHAWTKYLFFIVYNFLLKCLNSLIAVAFRAPKRCGLSFN
ncbi:hypothetical protein EMIT043CA1_70279 [Pseudomonas brassicacearum]